MKRAVIIYEGVDGKVNFCNLDADGIVKGENGVIEIWKGDNELVGIFRKDATIAAYISEKTQP